MLLGEPYDHRVDVWALGILLYELLHGKAPYPEEISIPEKMDLIKSKRIPIVFREGVSDEVAQLVRSLLERSPEKRMTLEEVFYHPWMKRHEPEYDIDISSYVSQNSRNSNISNILSNDPSLPEENSIFKTNSTQSRARRAARSVQDSSQKVLSNSLFLIIELNTDKQLMMKKIESETVKAENSSIWASFINKLGCGCMGRDIKEPDLT